MIDETTSAVEEIPIVITVTSLTLPMPKGRGFLLPAEVIG